MCWSRGTVVLVDRVRRAYCGRVNGDRWSSFTAQGIRMTKAFTLASGIGHPLEGQVAMGTPSTAAVKVGWITRTRKRKRKRKITQAMSPRCVDFVLSHSWPPFSAQEDENLDEFWSRRMKVKHLKSFTVAQETALASGRRQINGCMT